MNTLIETNRFLIAPVDEQSLDGLLLVYQQSEDFLVLGPVPTASVQMVKTDIEYSHKAGGLYCGLWDKNDLLFGVLDFIPQFQDGTSFLTLLMISSSCRGQKLGTEIVTELEKYLKSTYAIHRLESAVQINNFKGVHFWEKLGFQIDKRPLVNSDGTIVFKMMKTFE